MRVPARATRRRRAREDFLFDITDAVDDLETAGRWDERRIAVTSVRPSRAGPLSRRRTSDGVFVSDG